MCDQLQRPLTQREAPQQPVSRVHAAPVLRQHAFDKKPLLPQMRESAQQPVVEPPQVAPSPSVHVDPLH